MQWAVVCHPDQFLNGRLIQTPRAIPEDSVPVAMAQGWIVLATESALVPADVPVPLNPPRIIQPGEDA